MVLVKDENYRGNPDYSLVIYLTAEKVVQCILVAENMREKGEAKKERANKIATRKLHL